MSRIRGVLALAATVAARPDTNVSLAASAIMITLRGPSLGILDWFIDLRRPEARTSLAAR